MNSIDFEKKIFLTFDWDWAIDEVLQYTLDILNKEDINATFFVTHYTQLLEDVRKYKNIELGIHPNFNNILIGSDNHDFNQILSDCKKIVPEAVSCRSHALLQSSRILCEYEKFGLKYDLNTYIPLHSKIILKPYDYLNSVIKVPHFFADDAYLTEDNNFTVEDYLNTTGIKVFDFHPIHIYLNSEKIQRYEDSKVYYKDFNMLQNFRNRDIKCGIEYFLKKLISLTKDFQFLKVSDLLPLGN